MISALTLSAALMMSGPALQDPVLQDPAGQDSGDAETHRLNAEVLARLQAADAADAQARAEYEASERAREARIA